VGLQTKHNQSVNSLIAIGTQY